jgi:hypothetical protein
LPQGAEAAKPHCSTFLVFEVAKMPKSRHFLSEWWGFLNLIDNHSYYDIVGSSTKQTLFTGAIQDEN